MNYKLLTTLILTGSAWVFLIQISAVTDGWFPGWKVSMSRSTMILALLCAGIGISWLLHSIIYHRRATK